MNIFRKRCFSAKPCLMMIFSLQSLFVLCTFFYFGVLPKRQTKIYRRIGPFRTNGLAKDSSILHPLTPDARPSYSCQPVNNFVFVKTHKTGSTTLRSITSRYGYTRDLSFLLSNDGRIGHFNGISLRYSSESSNFLPPLGVKKNDFPNYQNYNISNVHLKYNRRSLDKFMYRRHNLTLFTILRTPEEQWLSWFQYYKKYTKVGFKADGISEAAMPYIERLEKENGDFNQQSRDLGINDKKHFNDTLLRETVTEMTKDFNLVMITEYFDESLILLRKMMCWTFEDILYVSKRKQPMKTQFPDDVKEKLYQYNHADVYIYEYFNRTLWRKIEEYGPSFKGELRYFRQLLTKKQNECIGQNSTTNGRREFVEYHSLQNTSEFCELYVNENFQLDSKIYRKQGGIGNM
ncbi:galactosylceramide sulfotransferase-like isoform X2 [Apostichopus japonicus]|uniref:galactosylceramide sulfotransferase-like isoform X2 n=1 Tax=Stichopus japonicus TaxID=307972 RepID=UPI003AB217E7